MKRTRPVGVIALLGVVLCTVCADAGVISSGPFDVGIVTDGVLCDPFAGIGFRRNSDGYEPIKPAINRDSWGVSFGSFRGYVDPQYYRVAHIASFAAIFTSTTATTRHQLKTTGGAALLEVVQFFSFAADNVLNVHTTVTNLTAVAGPVLFQRNVDWSISPTIFREIITVDPIAPFAPFVKDVTYSFFEYPDPLRPYRFSARGGGTFGPRDYGAGIKLDLGVLGPGESKSFDYYYAISQIGQTEAGLRAQLNALGVNYLITGRDSGNPPVNFAALGVAVPTGGGPVISEPGSVVLTGVALVILTGLGLHRRLRPKIA